MTLPARAAQAPLRSPTDGPSSQHKFRAEYMHSAAEVYGYLENSKSFHTFDTFWWDKSNHIDIFGIIHVIILIFEIFFAISMVSRHFLSKVSTTKKLHSPWHIALLFQKACVSCTKKARALADMQVYFLYLCIRSEKRVDNWIIFGILVVFIQQRCHVSVSIYQLHSQICYELNLVKRYLQQLYYLS